MSRVYNFSAGPSMLPEEVLKKAAAEMLDYNGSGQSVMEMSHRSKVYDEIIKGAEALVREIMLLQVNGQTKHIKKLQDTAKLKLLHLQQIKHIHIFQSLIKIPLLKMLTTSIFV